MGHQWTADTWWSAVRCRLGRFGAHSRVPPGLYALGRPDARAAVIVTASYRLTFDLLRRGLDGIECWMLVLDTRGLDVGSAVSSGIFGTDELVTRIAASRLSGVVSNRVLVLPPRSAPVIDGTLLEKSAGFQVRFGPVRISDLPRFLAGEGGEKAPVPVGDGGFGLWDALALIPVEIGRSLMRFPGFAFAAILFAGLGPGGVSLDRAFAGSWPLLVLGLASVLTGSFLAPALRALVPGVPLWLAGGALGGAATAALLQGAGLITVMDRFLAAACWAFFPTGSAFMAAQFVHALPRAAGSPRGWKSTLLTVAAALACAFTAGALVLSRMSLWRQAP